MEQLITSHNAWLALMLLVPVVFLTPIFGLARIIYGMGIVLQVGILAYEYQHGTLLANWLNLFTGLWILAFIMAIVLHKRTGSFW